MNICSCVDLSQDKTGSNIKIHNANLLLTHPLTMKNSENNVNSFDVNDGSVFMSNRDSNVNVIESYNYKNNFFYFLNQITKLQRFYKERYKKKHNYALSIKTTKTVKKIFIANIDNEGQERVIDSEVIASNNGNQFNYEKFKSNVSSMDALKNSIINDITNNYNKLYTPQTTLYEKPDIIKKKTKDFVRDIVKRKTENKKYNIPIASQEGCSLTVYMNNCQASFRSTCKSTIIHDINEGGVGTEPRGCFLKKRMKFKFEGNVNVETKKKEGFGKITWNDESILLANFMNNRANNIAYYNDKPNVSEFSGYYIENHPQGYGIFKAEGIITEGEWDKNMLTGIGREYSDKDTYYQGEYVNCGKTGIGLYRWSDGTIYEGEWNNNQMTGFGIISFNDDKLYFGQVHNGIMEGYGEFHWGKEEQKYMGYYKNDLKHGFGIYTTNQGETQTYMGFWEKGKMNGVGLIIRGKKIKYGVWKNGLNEKWLQGSWELRKYATNKSDYYKYIKIMELTQNKISNFLCKFLN